MCQLCSTQPYFFDECHIKTLYIECDVIEHVNIDYPSLRYIRFDNCKQLKSFEAVMPCLRAMCIDNCPLVNMINVRASKKVLLAQIRNCNSLANVNLESTRHVDLTVLSCSSLTGISASTLVSLEVRHCGSLETLRQYPMLTNLNLEAMESLKDIPVYPIVEYFSIESCPSLITIFTNSHRLGHARVLKCEKLESIVHKSSVENGYSVTNLCKSLASIHLGNFKSSTLSRCPSHIYSMV
jgi:hypothetical protein